MQLGKKCYDLLRSKKKRKGSAILLLARTTQSQHVYLCAYVRVLRACARASKRVCAFVFTFFSRSVASSLNFSSDSLLIFSILAISSASVARIFISFASARAVATSPCMIRRVPTESVVNGCTQKACGPQALLKQFLFRMCSRCSHTCFVTTCSISISAASAAIFSWLRLPRTEYGSTELFESASDSSAGNAERVEERKHTETNRH